MKKIRLPINHTIIFIGMLLFACEDNEGSDQNKG